VKKRVGGDVVVSKGITLASQQLKYAGGIAIAMLVTFSIWWLWFLNRYERIAIRSAIQLLEATDRVCETGEPVYVSFYLPQEVGFRGWVYQHLGITGGNVGTDPYFYLYYEEFPPKSEFLSEGIPVIAPWREDLPWSSNLMQTAVLDLLGLGFNMGFGKMSTKLRKVIGESVEESSKLQKLMEKGEDVSMKLKQVVGKLTESPKLQKLMKAGKIFVKGGKIVIREAPSFTAATVAGTVACLWANPDRSLGECAVFAATGYTLLRVSHKTLSYMRQRYKKKVAELAIQKITEETIPKLERIYEETADEGFEFLLQELEREGKIFRKGEKYYVKDKEWEEALRLLWKEKKKDKLGIFKFVAEDRIEVDKKGWKEKFKAPLKKAWERAKKELKEHPQVAYTLLRIQDFYTPLGVTWWDRQISYYRGYDYCGEEEFCLRSGWRVIHFKVEEKLPHCHEKGIKKFKLRRNSLVAPNPDFYLVSPCISVIKIEREGDTIYFEPKLCENKPEEFKNMPNYCYATAGTVNFYVGTETVSFFADCIGNIVCCAVTVCEGGAALLGILKACVGIGTKIPDVCGAISEGIRLLLDVTREAIITYPYIPQGIQDEVWGGRC